MKETLRIITFLVALCTTVLLVSAVAIFGIPERIIGMFSQPAPLAPTTQDVMKPTVRKDLASTTLPTAMRATSSPAPTTSPVSVSPKIIPTKATSTPHKIPPVVKKPVVVAVNTPGPLVVTPAQDVQVANPVPVHDEIASPSTVGALNQNGILLGTNAARIADGKTALVFNKRLSAIAEAKALDMIEKGYFAHVSPTGVDIEKLASTYGYKYLNIGENLALGDFTSSEDVVNGWMNSPGHRANILNEHYTEIGIAAMLGEYQGRTVWFAVQEFGRPLADCPSPDEVLKKKIDIFTGQLDSLESSLANLKKEIETTNMTRQEYDLKAKDYNTLVGLYNDVLATAKGYIAEYNKQVDSFNSCVGS